MSEVIGVQFHTSGEDANRRLIREYVFDAIDRLAEVDSVENTSFMQFTHGSPDRATVSLTVVGDPDEVVAHESDRWDELVADGVALDWEVNEHTELWEQQYGERSIELRLQLADIANKASRAAFEEFGEAPPIVDAYPDENSAYPIGWYSLLHQVTLQQGYSFDEELEAYLRGIEVTLDNLKNHEEDGYVSDRIDEIVDAVEAKRPGGTE